MPGQPTGNIMDEVQKMMNKKVEETNALATERVKAHNDMVSNLFVCYYCIVSLCVCYAETNVPPFSMECPRH